LKRRNQTIVIPSDELERLVRRFGPGVRQMGVWHHSSDGPLELSAADLAEAVKSVGNSPLTEAVRRLKSPDEFSAMLGRCSAAMRLIEEAGRVHLSRFEGKVRLHQDSQDPDEVLRLKDQISRELFGV
jgi:hypothetical protein